MPRKVSLLIAADASIDLSLSLYRDRLQLEMPANQERSRANKLPCRVILRREVARVNGIEFLKERQVRTGNLHVDQVIHLFRHFSGLWVHANSSRQVERIPGQDPITERRRNRSSGQLNHLSRRLY